MTGPDLADLDRRILAAHKAGRGRDLARAYAEAADAAAAAGDADREAFFLTQAYVFALDTGAAEAGRYAARLRAAGRHD
ncbi:MAG: hypothetical protein QNJ13_05780 [Paracoccaceae bacterium]|nr:hypothetical protein [Paracoccaceae bacterium]